MYKVFVTDASYRHAVSAIRSLARGGFQVTAGDTTRWAQGFYSRACRQRVICPSPDQEEEFADFLAEYCKHARTDVLLPIGYSACRAISRYQQKFAPSTKMAVADWEAMQIAGHKRKTMEVAKQVGLHVPKTYSAPEEVESFPVVVKPSLGSGTVQFVNSMPELMAAYEADCVIQDYIAGQGFGFSALLRHGELRACCMHRRVREFPITGGASTAAVTVLKPELRRAGMRILQELKWHGVAMVEFKKDERDGQYKLLEINPKFWGSLDLPIAAGVDFPTLTARLALEGDVETVPDAPPGIKFHWIWDDLLHLAANPSSWNAVMHDMVSRDVASDLDWSDPIPFLVHGGYMLRRLLGLLLKAKLRYPQGRASATSAAQGNGRAAKSHR